MISVSGSSNYALEQLSQLNDDSQLFLSLALLSTRTLAATTIFFLSCIGFFDQWLIGGLLDGCVAIISAGKMHVRCVHVYITTLEHNKVSGKTLTAKRIQTSQTFLFIKTRTNSMLKYC